MNRMHRSKSIKLIYGDMEAANEGEDYEEPAEDMQPDRKAFFRYKVSLTLDITYA